MAGSQYVALLRGINVGGRNPVAMADLRAALSERFDAVETYIQSGNVLFATAEPAKELEVVVEEVVERAFGLSLVVVVRSHRQLRSVVDSAPPGFGTDPTTYHSDVVFLRSPLTPAAALQAADPREGVDEVWAGTGVLYFRRLSARRAQSRLSRLASTGVYQWMTIRNWATTTKLLELLDARAPA